MAYPEVTRTGDVFVIAMTDNENRFNRTSVDALHACLDEIDGAEGQKSMVTVGEGKFFSNGLDLEWLGTGEEDMFGFIADVTRLWARILEAPYPTVAAINGHAFAGGSMFALAFDQRVMREDRGFWCVNEVLLGMDLTPGMGAIVQARLDKHTAHKAVTQAHRFSGPDALQHHIVDAIASEAEVLTTAMGMADSLKGTAGEPLAVLKRRLYAPVLELLRP
jgi:enoyl-CoA hydratase/carnithine racemase